MELLRKRPLFLRFPFEYPYHDDDGKGIFIKQSAAGMKASNFFHLDNRLAVGSRHNERGAYEAWDDKKYRKMILGAFWTLDKNVLDYIKNTLASV